MDGIRRDPVARCLMLSGMDNTAPIKKIRAVSKCRGPKTWAVARERYLAGETARAICRDLDLGVANLYRRAAAEGWRKRDLPDLPPPPRPEVQTDDAEPVPVDVRAAIRASVDRAFGLVAKDQFVDAARAIKTAELFARIAEQLTDPTQRDPVADAAAKAELYRRITALCEAEAATDDA